MTSNETRTRKRRKSAASESGLSLASQDSIFESFDALDMSSQPDDSTSQRQFKIFEPLLLKGWSILQKAFSRVTDFLM